MRWLFFLTDVTFQLRFIEVIGSCHEFVVSVTISYYDFYERMYHSQSDNRDAKLEDITNTVIRILTASCADCGITSDIIDMELFACFSQSHVTY